MKETRTVSVFIARSPKTLYDYLADPSHYPEWSDFIAEIQQEEGDWVATTPNGQVRIAFTPRNSYFILDHVVTVSPDLTVYVPMRVVKNEEGSEVLFTVFRLAGISDEQYEADIGMVTKDLANLKRSVETK